MHRRKKRNAYMLFVEEWMAENPNTSFEEACRLADADWRNLPPEEKAAFKERAKRVNFRPIQLAFNARKRENGLPKELEKPCNYTPEVGIKVIQDLINQDESKLFKKDFYIIAFNVAVRTREGICIPNEFGAVQVSLEKGIKEQIHGFILPGEIPTGYLGEAKQHKENTHKIPTSGISFVEFNPNMAGTSSIDDQEIYSESVLKAFKAINAFVKPEEESKKDDSTKKTEKEEIKKPRPVFCCSDKDESGIIQTFECLRRLGYETGNSWFVDDFIVLDIKYLIWALATHATRRPAILQEIEDKLDSKSKDITLGTTCNFHLDSESNGLMYCAIAVAARCGYYMLNEICPRFNLDVPENKYIVPIKVFQNLEPFKASTNAEWPGVERFPLEV